MQTLYYSVIGILAIIVHLIINHEMFTSFKKQKTPTVKFFHIYLLTVLLYYITDVLWGLIDFLGNTRLLYIDTIAYYISMALSVVFCCRYVISYLNLNSLFGKILKSFGFIFCISEFILLIINHFVPIFFYFDSDGKYQTGTFRNIALITQVVMFAGITSLSYIVAFKKSEKITRRNATIYFFGLSMTIAIIAQGFFPLLPLYSIGLMIGTCILHVFIQEDEKNEQFEVLKSLSEIFYSMHVIDLANDTADEFRAVNEVKKIANHRNNASEMMKQVMVSVTSEDYIEKALEFTDLSTIRDRMNGKKFITEELVGNRVGWFAASFIPIETDSENKPTKLIYTTRIIDEEKKQKEKLIKKTQTDEMTGLLNRRAYEEDIYIHNDIPEEDDFVYVSIDVNGLKIVNDSLGHMAGDELIIGTCQCMTKALGSYGKLYRIGGDEFVAILFCKSESIEGILKNFEKTLSNWSGKLIDKISVSYGWISKEESPDSSVRQLGAVAEKRMYEAKSAHYHRQGVDRRGQQDAHKALCELYTKILRINITEDSYQIINMDESEKTAEKGFADKISEWLISFGKSGHVHPEDLDEYLSHTNLEYMKNYFKGNKTSLSIFYRRKYDTGYKKVMMEIIPTNDYSNDNQTLFLYVKSIDK